MTDMFVENTPEGRPPRSWDFFLTIFFIFVLLVLTVIFVFSALGFGVVTLTCADSSAECNYEFISYGSLLVLFGVPIVTLAGVVMSVVWIARRKLSFWIPLVACSAAIGVFMLGSFLVSSAVPGA